MTVWSLMRRGIAWGGLAGLIAALLHAAFSGEAAYLPFVALIQLMAGAVSGGIGGFLLGASAEDRPGYSRIAGIARRSVVGVAGFGVPWFLWMVVNYFSSPLLVIEETVAGVIVVGLGFFVALLWGSPRKTKRAARGV